MLCHAWRLRCLYLRITVTRRSSGCIGNTLWISLAAKRDQAGFLDRKWPEFETALERDPDPIDSILWGSGGKWGHLRLWQLFLWYSQWRSNARSLEISDDPNLSLMPCHVPAASPLRGSCHPASVWSWKMATRSCSGQGTPRSGMRDESIHDCRILQDHPWTKIQFK